MDPVRRKRPRIALLAVMIFIGLSTAAHAEGGGRVTGDAGLTAMIILGGIMTATYVAIAFEWLHKSLAAMAGATLAVIAAMVLGLYGSRGFEAVHETIGHELGVLGVLLGTSILVEIAGHSGLFHFISVRIVKATRGDPRRLFLATILLTWLFCSLLTIAPGTLIMVTLVLTVTRSLDLDPKPYVVGVALAANSGALSTFASGICTMMVASKAGLAYGDFFRVTLPVGVVTVAVVHLVVGRLYRTSLAPSGDPEARARRVASFDEWALVHDRRIFWRCAVILGLTVLGFALARNLGVGLDLVAMGGGSAALLFSGFDAEKAIKTVKWPLIVFFVGLFVIIGAVQETGLLGRIAGLIEAVSGGSMLAAMLVTGVFVMVLSGIVDNIPVAATLVPVVAAMSQGGADVRPLWWVLIVGANLGGNATPVGSVSCVIALHALEKERGIKVGWGEFLKVGGLTLAAQALVGLAWLVLLERFDLFPGSAS